MSQENQTPSRKMGLVSLFVIAVGTVVVGADAILHLIREDLLRAYAAQIIGLMSAGIGLVLLLISAYQRGEVAFESFTKLTGVALFLVLIAFTIFSKIT